MNEEHDNQKLEAYLRQFQVQAPKPLPGKRPQVYRRPIAVYAAVAAVLMGFFALAVWKWRWHGSGQQPSSQRIEMPEVSVVRLSRVAQEDPEKMDAYLNRLSKELLPDMRDRQGVLQQLAKGQ